jgi:tetratricopeptide (TPR) repeat protein
MDGNLDYALGENSGAKCSRRLEQLGDYHTHLGNFAAAQSCYEKAAAAAPDSAAPYVGLGTLALKDDRLEDADVAFRVARRLEPACAKAYAGLAAVAQQRKDYKQAFEMYLKCLELDTDDLTALLGLFQTSLQMGSFEKVTHYLELYLNAHPADTSVMFTLAALYVRDHRLDDAANILAALLKLDPQNEDAAALFEEIGHALAHNRTQEDTL